jgi:hypothetical protein
MDAIVWRKQLTIHPSFMLTLNGRQRAAAILDGITNGVDIGFTGDRAVSRCSANLRSALENHTVRDMVSAAIAKNVKLGKTAGPFDTAPPAPFSYSPIGAVMKNGSWEKIRVIHHLSFPYGGNSINSNIGGEELSLGRFDDACDFIRRVIGRGGKCFLIKLDVEAAYKQVAVRIADRALLGFKWEGKFYFELTLPFGLKSSGYRWELYAAALHYFFHHHLGVELVIHYVDDFLFVVDSREGGMALKAAALELCTRLGVPMAPDKAEGPSECLTFLGIELDTVAMTARLPAKKLSALRLLLDMWVSRQHCTIHDLQSLTGSLRWACHVVRPGRAWLRRLIALTTELCRQRGRTDCHGEQQHSLTASARADVRWWHRFIGRWNGVSLILDIEWTNAIKLQLYTDACYESSTGKGGWGGRYGNRWIQGEWTPEQLALAKRAKGYSIPFLELYALVLAVCTWSHEWAGRKIMLHCDCQPIVFACRKAESGDSSIQAMLRHLTTTAALGQFDLRVRHIAGADNVVADALSRACTLQELRVLLPTARPTPDAVVPLPSLGNM